MLIYKSLHGWAPSYLADKLSLRPNKALRSDNQLFLNVPISTLRLKFYGDRAFSVAGPTLWNALHKNIRLYATLEPFKTFLKTYLFKKVCKVWPCTLLTYCASDLFLRFTLIFYYISSLYQLCQSLVIIDCYILTLYHDCVTLVYFIALYVLFVFMYSAGEHWGSALYKSINHYVINYHIEMVLQMQLKSSRRSDSYMHLSTSSSLVSIMAWSWFDAKRLFESMLTLC